MEKFAVLWKGTRSEQSHRGARNGNKWSFPSGIWIEIHCTLCGGRGIFLPHSDTPEAQMKCIKCRVGEKHICPQCDGKDVLEEDKNCFRSMAKMNPKSWEVRETSEHPVIEKAKEVGGQIMQTITATEPTKESKRLFSRTKK